MPSNDLKSLIELSARIGRDLNLVQAGGGNTSLKEGKTLWIKASGKWMVNAGKEDMFVLVPQADINRNLAAENEKFPDYATESGVMLRPSVETAMHAVLPHRVVIHVHSVSTIACAAQMSGESFARDRLTGLRWAWIPYIHPGVPLALRIRESLASAPDVLLLENHGLVVGADDCESVERLLQDVEQRLAVPVKPAREANRAILEDALEDSSWKIAEDNEHHAIATDLPSCRIAVGGTMYPDHCVYLGPAAPHLKPGESFPQAIASYVARHGYEPQYVLVEGAGVLTSNQLSRAGAQLLTCLKRVLERIPNGSQVRYLEDRQVARLMNWDAEKYRLAVARQND
jgi:rhamnose utilization protein RhaD (predicted bifunctional aldolase and dehydrogenase)